MDRSLPGIFLHAHGYAVLVVGTFLVGVPWLAHTLFGLMSDLRLPAALVPAGYVLLPLAGTLSYSSFWLFMTRGRGTAFPTDPPRTLLILGPYRYVRNPMYVGNLAIAFAEALAFRSVGALLYAILLSVVTHLYVSRLEEPALTARYGDAYRRYLKTVPRWVPSLTRGLGGDDWRRATPTG
jgi:protein-S-isoprenylcysteine O-methyltransferase Ste14